MSEDHFDENRLAETREGALVMLDDLRYLRSVLAKTDPTPGDVRRLVPQLRRILIEGDLQKIAAPRIGRAKLLAPDVQPYLASNLVHPFRFVSVGEVYLFGFHLVSLSIRTGKNESFGQRQNLSLSVDKFLSQEVICVQGEWSKRADIIKYMAYLGGAVHSGKSKNDPTLDDRIRNIRAFTSASFEDGGLNMKFGGRVMGLRENAMDFSRSSIDFALIQVFSTAHYLVNSPDVQKLEKVIEAQRS